MEANTQFRGFISYSHRDERWAAWLHRALETYRLPRTVAAAAEDRRLGRFFRDRDELATSVDLGARITEALQGSANLIVICSPAAAASRWVNEEIRRFKQIGGEDRVFAFIVDGEPPSCFPAALLERHDSDGAPLTAAGEPIAADARSSGDGRRAALLKLIAGLIDQSYDTLRQREAQRRHRRMLLVTAGSLASAVLFAGIAGFALVQRNEAITQRARAQTEARTASETAAFLTSLFEVADPGENRGRTVTAREILDAGARRIAADLKSEPGVRMRLSTTMGTVYTGLGLYNDAERLARAAVMLADRNGTREDAARTRAELGRVLLMQSRYSDALQVLDQARGADAALPPELGAAIEARRSEVLLELDRVPDAEAAAGASLALARRAHGPRHADVAEALSRLALAQSYAGKNDEARALFLQALVMRRGLLGPDHPLVAVDLNELGFVEYAAGNEPAAERYFQQALAIYEKVGGAHHAEVSSLLNNLGRMQLLRNDLAAAHTTLTRAVDIDRRTRSEESDQLVYSLNSLGMVEMARGAYGRADMLFSEALPLARSGEAVMEGQVLTNIADLACRRRAVAAGREAAAQARVLLERDYPEEPWRIQVVRSIEALCAAHAGAGDAPGAARAALAALRATQPANGWFVAQARWRAAQADAAVRLPG